MATAKYAPTDWHTSNTVIRSSAEKQRLTSHTIRNQSNITRNETGKQFAQEFANDWFNVLTRTICT